ncbi:hypothetical protein [Paenibacillus sp. MBLB4367]|uniref:hypothetical protein n=1 Tax=Paenibacillus sp. MBLB4367 TaxID=3384767 RepID=UPI003908237F
MIDIEAEEKRRLIEQHEVDETDLRVIVKKQLESAEAGEKIRSDYESLQRKYADLEREMASLTERHARELEWLSEKKDIEREREIIKLRTEYQEDIEKLRRELSGKLVGLYEELHARNRSSGAGLEEEQPPAEPEA